MTHINIIKNFHGSFRFFLSRLPTLILLCYFSSLIITHNGYWIFPILVTIVIIAEKLILSNEFVYRFPKYHVFILSTSIFMICCTLLIFYHQDSISFLDPIWKLIFVIMLFVYLYNKNPNLSKLLIGISISCVSCLIMAIFQILEGDMRASGFTYHNMFGALSILLSFLSLSGFFAISEFYRISTKCKILKSMLFFAFLSGVAASILSGSKGAWIAAPIMTVIIAFYWINIRNIIICFSVLIFIPIISLQFGDETTFLSDRLDQFQQISIFFQDYKICCSGSGGHQTNETEYYRLYFGDISIHSSEESIIQRMKFYHETLIIIENNIFLGIGRDKLARLITSTVPGYNAVHNDYLEFAAFGGIIGIFVVSAVFVLPLTYLVFSAGGTAEARFLRSAIALCVVGFAVFSLTNSLLIINAGVATFFGIQAVLFGILRSFEVGK